MTEQTRYIVVPQGSSFSRRFAIKDLTTGFVVEGGFSSSAAAWAYIDREYSEEAD